MEHVLKLSFVLTTYYLLLTSALALVTGLDIGGEIDGVTRGIGPRKSPQGMPTGTGGNDPVKNILDGAQGGQKKDGGDEGGDNDNESGRTDSREKEEGEGEVPTTDTNNDGPKGGENDNEGGRTGNREKEEGEGEVPTTETNNDGPKGGENDNEGGRTGNRKKEEGEGEVSTTETNNDGPKDGDHKTEGEGDTDDDDKTQNTSGTSTTTGGVTTGTVQPPYKDGFINSCQLCYSLAWPCLILAYLAYICACI